jgi:hypothetical protein
MSSGHKTSKLFYACMSILIVCCLCTVCYILFRAGAQESLNNAAQAQTISGTTPQKFGLCPNNPTWTAQKFTNGTYCVQPGSTATTDSKGNLTGAVIGACPKPMQTINGISYCVTSQ